MTYMVRRPRGRWEIRESYLSSDGPRARTLATFRLLSPEVIEHASQAAQTPLDADRLRASARRVGVPFQQPETDTLASSLIRKLARGETLRPGLRALLLDCLGAGEQDAVDGALAEWIGASLEERGAALIDLLGLADNLPKPRPSPLSFPGLASRNC